jgi:hypothetical protein
VGLRCLQLDWIDDGVFCGAPIGRGKKMCVKALCDVASHATKPKVSSEEFGGSEERVFIDVPPPTGKTEVSAVYLSPNLATDNFGG